ncbi:MAG TPA: lytic transglycosylase domain-containing protein [Solirubrobacteraceae bacterium]|jgi:soluble lytic murein transglycosylase|nr:lytic transglycosylase domain-containing protein [Solirubrobacteraceae bacterium]
MGVTNRSVNRERRNHSTYRAQPRGRIRRRRATVVLGLALLVVAVIELVPLAQRAIEHFELPLQYASIIRQQAVEKHIDPALIAAVIYAETRFRPRTSVTGAEGLMQIEPPTARFLAHRSHGYAFQVEDLGTPQVNIAYGTYYLRYLLNVYNGSKVLALAAYNGGETNVDNWLAKAHEQHRNFTISTIPLAQTRAYVAEVLGKQRAYRTQYAHQLGYSA